MDDLDSLEDVVIFELTTCEGVEAFSNRFRGRWNGWAHVDAEIRLFVAELAGDDLALLLREVQELVSALALTEIRFYLDGRVYVLRAAPQPECAEAVAVTPRLAS
jgi:hypothetical protein